MKNNFFTLIKLDESNWMGGSAYSTTSVSALLTDIVDTASEDSEVQMMFIHPNSDKVYFIDECTKYIGVIFCETDEGETSAYLKLYDKDNTEEELSQAINEDVEYYQWYTAGKVTDHYVIDIFKRCKVDVKVKVDLNK